MWRLKIAKNTSPSVFRLPDETEINTIIRVPIAEMLAKMTYKEKKTRRKSNRFFHNSWWLTMTSCEINSFLYYFLQNFNTLHKLDTFQCPHIFHNINYVQYILNEIMNDLFVRSLSVQLHICIWGRTLKHYGTNSSHNVLLHKP